MRTITGAWFVAPLAAVALLLPVTAADAANRGIVHVVGDRETTAILPSGDVDTFVFDVAAGGSLTVLVKAAKGVSLIPTLALVRPDGDEASEAELLAAKYNPGKSAAKIVNFPVDVTGRWAVRVSNMGPNQAGEYTLSTKVKPPKGLTLKGITLPQGGVHSSSFPMSPGSLLTVTFKRKAGGSDWKSADLSLRQPSGTPVPVATGIWQLSTKGIAAKNLDIATPFGDYTLRLPGPQTGGDAVGDLSVKVKWPKRKGIARTRSSAEPQVATVTPGSGNFGTTIVVAGQNFAEGAILEVGGSPATSLVRNPGGTQITGIVPVGTGTVDVTVANVDGQEGTKTEAFSYVPPPALSSIVPGKGPSTGGTAVTLTGTNFRSGMRVFFGAVQIVGPVQLTGTTTLNFTTESMPSGVYTVEVRDPAGSSATLPGAFTFERVLTPVPNAFSASAALTVVATTGLLGDIDKDALSKDDLILAYPALIPTGTGTYGASTRVFRGNNNRTFGDATAQSFPGQFFPTIPGSLGTGISGVDYGIGHAVALGDLDGDGDNDLVVGANGSFFTSSATLYFICPVTGAAIPSTNPANPLGYYYIRYPGTRIFKNTGNGTFVGSTVEFDATLGYSMPMPLLAQGVVWGEFFQATALSLGDLDQDGDLDLTLVTGDDFPAANLYIIRDTAGNPTGCGVNRFTSSALRMLLNDGTGKFTFSSTLTLSGGTTTESMQGVAIAVGDVDGDKDPDIVVAASGDTALTTAGLLRTRVAINSGGTFAKAPAALPNPTLVDGGDATSLRLSDIDGDGDLDLLIATPAFLEAVDPGDGSILRKSSTRVFLNDGAGVFTDQTATRMPAIDELERWDASGMALGDLDRDGDQDLILSIDTYFADAGYTTGFRSSTRILLNNGAGVFARAPAGFFPGVDLDPPNRTNPSFRNGTVVLPGDLDGDGDDDIVLASSAPITGVPQPASSSKTLTVIENR